MSKTNSGVGSPFVAAEGNPGGGINLDLLIDGIDITTGGLAGIDGFDGPKGLGVGYDLNMSERLF